MPKLISRPVKRFFAFGCSFTEYFWTTWPEIIAKDLNIDEYYNFGLTGAGNEFMFNRLMQVDNEFDLNENDLVIVCWTNTCREDRYANNYWITPGNIFSQKEYSDDFVKRYYQMPESSLVHDFAYIKASQTLLEFKNPQWHFLQMFDILEFANQWNTSIKFDDSFTRIFNNIQSCLQPSFYEVLWNNNLKNAKTSNFKFNDSHPTPIEHFIYLKNVFDHNWNDQTINQLNQLEIEHNEILNKMSVYSDYQKYTFRHLKPSLKCEYIY